MQPSLQPELWRLVVEHLVRPIPHPSQESSWHDLHQAHLATIMRVNSMFYSLAAPLLYDSPTVQDLSRFLYRSASSSPARPSKTELLQLVVSLTFSNTDHPTAPLDEDELPITGRMILHRTLAALSCTATAPALIPNVTSIVVRAAPHGAATQWRAFHSWMIHEDIDPLPMTQRAFAAFVQALSPHTVETYGVPTGPLVYLCRSPSGHACSFSSHHLRYSDIQGKGVSHRPAGITVISHHSQLEPRISIVKGAVNRLVVEPVEHRGAIRIFVKQLVDSLVFAELEKGAEARVEVVGACWPGAVDDGVDKARVEEEELLRAGQLLDKALTERARGLVSLHKRSAGVVSC